MKPDAESFDVFISYSREDATLVSKVADLFRGLGLNPFRDEQSIRPGTKWRIAIAEALEDCQLVCVFWCRHAAESRDVSEECRKADELGKPLIPVLLQSHPLGMLLSKYQGIDMSDIVRHRDFILKGDATTLDEVSNNEVIDRFRARLEKHLKRKG